MNSELDRLLEDRKIIDAKIEALNKSKADINEQIETHLQSEPDRKYANSSYSVSVVQKFKTVYDWEGLKARVGAVRFKDLLSPDPELVGKAIAEGKITTSEAAKFQSKVPQKPGVTIRRK